MIDRNLNNFVIKLNTSFVILKIIRLSSPMMIHPTRRRIYVSNRYIMRLLFYKF